MGGASRETLRRRLPSLSPGLGSAIPHGEIIDHLLFVYSISKDDVYYTVSNQFAKYFENNWVG